MKNQIYQTRYETGSMSNSSGKLIQNSGSAKYMRIPDVQIKLTKLGNICAFIKFKPDGLGCCHLLYERLLDDFGNDFQHLMNYAMGAVVFSCDLL